MSDTSVTATATVNVVTATTPTVTSVSPNTTAFGGLFQDIYITGTNFISTDNVFVNGTAAGIDVRRAVAGIQLADSSAHSGLHPGRRRRPKGSCRSASPSNPGAIQTCTTDRVACQITVAGVRPGVVGPSPDSIPQGTAGVLSFGVDGGFFGTGSNPASPAVSATFNGQLRAIQLPASQTIGSTRQLSVTIGGGSNSSDFTVPGLYPVTIKSTTDPTKFAVTNLAVQPTYKPPAATTYRGRFDRGLGAERCGDQPGDGHCRRGE